VAPRASRGGGANGGAAKVFRCVGVEKKQKSERISLLGYLYAHARPRTRAGARQRARHRNGEVAAAELGQDGVARGGSSSARGRRAAAALA